ncbi:uncharacterized protein LOC131944778 [Physella acuta]|uniref:uncharacterized protein LOC131944778 n=1 Tax=Physella acuta TaxID=109671 RepID=UPI0027DB70D6|nr:uncharacterized protein LOC131944778 [Physella acuta]
MAHKTTKQIEFLNTKLESLQREKHLLQTKIDDSVKKITDEALNWTKGNSHADFQSICSIVDATTYKLVEIFDSFNINSDPNTKTEECTDNIKELQSRLDMLEKTQHGNDKKIRKISKQLEGKNKEQIDILQVKEQLEALTSKVKDIESTNDSLKTCEDVIDSKYNTKFNKVIEDVATIRRDLESNVACLNSERERNKKIVCKLLSSELVKLDRLEGVVNKNTTKQQETKEELEEAILQIYKLQWKSPGVKITMNFLLVGRRGVGKTSTGNSILGSSKFGTTKINHLSQTEEVYSTEVKGEVTSVTDTVPFLQDSTNLIPRQIEAAHLGELERFHAFVFVIRYGQLERDEDVAAFDDMKKVYGDDFTRDYCVVGMCCGDVFYRENPSQCFKSWCAKQTGPLGYIFRHCSERVILFDNVTDDGAMKELQIAQIKNTVYRMPHRGVRYKHKKIDKGFYEVNSWFAALVR